MKIENKKIYGSNRNCIVNERGEILSFDESEKQLKNKIIFLLDGVYGYNTGKIINLSEKYRGEIFNLDGLIKIKKELEITEEYIYVLDAYETFNTYIVCTNEEVEEVEYEGTGFNYGSNNVIKNKKGFKNIIVLGEND